jgi:hypothetical protein
VPQRCSTRCAATKAKVGAVLSQTLLTPELFTRMYNSGRLLRIVVARNTPGVTLPRGTPALDHPFVTLELGRDLPRPVRDLDIGVRSVDVRLNFGGMGWHRCVIPYSAMRALYYADTNEGFWQSGPAPAEKGRCLAGEQYAAAASEEITKVGRRPSQPRLRVIRGGKA